MERLIDADEAYKVLTDYYHHGTEIQHKALKEAIGRVPIVDAEPVVRCKDCKKYIPCQKLPIGTSKWCDMFDRATCEMNYCGWGERIEDGKV